MDFKLNDVFRGLCRSQVRVPWTVLTCTAIRETHLKLKNHLLYTHTDTLFTQMEFNTRDFEVIGTCATCFRNFWSKQRNSPL